VHTVPNQEPKASSVRPLAVPAPVRNPATLLLFWLSKTDPHLVSVCSRWAMATQAALGMFVLFSASLAFLAAYYTFSTLNVSESLIPWIAFGYSGFILACDREIAGSLEKTTALVRPFLALIISAVVTIPVELYVFQARVDQELDRQYREDNKSQLAELHVGQTKLEQRRSSLETTLAELRKQEADWANVLDSEAVGRSGIGRTGIPGIGPAFQNAQTQQTSVRQRMQEVRRDLEEIERSLPAERQRLESQLRREEIRTTKDFVSRYEALDRVIRSSDALYRLSWIIWAALAMIELAGAVLKMLTPLADYHHLVKAEIRERCARIDELGERNFRLAIENPEVPRLSVTEKFTIAWYTPISSASSSGRR